MNNHKRVFCKFASYEYSCAYVLKSEKESSRSLDRRKVTEEDARKRRDAVGHSGRAEGY